MDEFLETVQRRELAELHDECAEIDLAARVTAARVKRLMDATALDMVQFLLDRRGGKA